MPSFNHLFLLFLLLLVLLPALLAWKPVRGYVTRTINLVARALSVTSRAWASKLFRAPIAHEELPRTTTMSDNSVPRRNETERWSALIRESEATIEKHLFPEIDMDLATFIRCTTFRVFLVVFLGVDPNAFAFADLQLVTGALSAFYDDGQGRSSLPVEAQRILNHWLPRRRFPSSLDHILPAYEALWRIVATIVVTCEDDETKNLRWVMLDFRDNPRERQYTASFGGDGRSVSSIVDDVAGRIPPVARPQQATTSTWPLSCIRYASPSNSSAYPPTRPEALKFAALLASMVIGRVGVHYGISGGGVTFPPAVSPWDRRKIFGVDRALAHLAVEMRSHASTSRQVY